MAAHSGFTDAEWARLVESPLLAAIAVTAAEPSGVLGLLRESLAAAEALAAARAEVNANPLVRAVAEAYATPEGRGDAEDAVQRHMQGCRPADVTAHAVAGLVEVARLLETKAPADAAAFKAWLHAIGERVAEAATEGGFLGLGGVKVSAAERATLAEIGRALRLDA